MGANLRKEGIERGGSYAQMLAQSPLVVETWVGVRFYAEAANGVLVTDASKRHRQAVTTFA